MTIVSTNIITSILGIFAGYMLFLLKERRAKKELLYEKSIVSLMRLENGTEDGKVSIKYGDKEIHSLHAIDITVFNLGKHRIQYEDFDQIERPFTVLVEGEGKILGARVIETKPENLIPIDLIKELCKPYEKSVGIKPIAIGRKQRLKIRLLVGNLQETDQVKVNIHGNFETKESLRFRWIFHSLIGVTCLIFLFYYMVIRFLDQLPGWFNIFYYLNFVGTILMAGLVFYSLNEMGYIKELRKISKLNNKNYQGK
ncbi:hypothetical protein ACFQ4Y_07935 [Kroppenstedtia sanguinis]|uniref:Uncharacterized protein n=1 Tax=Kroppenstedtia sanguinis TaxID=1380684 RepID=A0ABW4CAA3_9BACL